jgi:adenylate kinase
MDFPIFKTKQQGKDKKFNLTNPSERKEYFELKAGDEIKKLRKYLENDSFVVYLLGKKNSGKGTYSKMFAEIIGPEKIFHFSVGDMTREIDEELKDKTKRAEFIKCLEKNYRGWMSIDEIVSTLESRSVKKLLPTELILCLVKREIAKHKGKAIFIDGFPRAIFALIDVPEKVIDERIKSRRICPKCKTSRNLKLLPSSKIGYKEQEKEFYLMCDNPECENAEMKLKEGDEIGIETMRERMNLDDELLRKAFSLRGVPKILLRNSIPVDKADENIDNYEITAGYSYKWDEQEKKVNITKKPWTAKNDEGEEVYSLMPPPVVLSLMHQLVEVLKI